VNMVGGKVVNAGVWGVMLSLALSVAPAKGQEAPVSFGEPLDTYVSELVSYQYGAAPYCMVDGSERILAGVEGRLRRITAALVTQKGQDLVTRAKKEAIKQFEAESANVDFAACKVGDAAFDRQKRAALKAVHLPNLKVLETVLGLARKK
jgi:hypothetical protein